MRASARSRLSRLVLPVAALLVVLAIPCGAHAHSAPMVDLPPIQLPDHGDPFAPDENMTTHWNLGGVENRFLRFGY